MLTGCVLRRDQADDGKVEGENVGPETIKVASFLSFQTCLIAICKLDSLQQLLLLTTSNNL